MYVQVYKAVVKATQEVVALKLLNLEKFGANLVSSYSFYMVKRHACYVMKLHEGQHGASHLTASTSRNGSSTCVKPHRLAQPAVTSGSSKTSGGSNVAFSI